MKIKTHGFLLLLLFLLLPSSVHAAGASLYLSPVSTSRVAGESITVNAYVSSEAQSINAIQGTINFPTDKLSIVSLDRGVSSVNFWVKEPSFSNDSGTIEFEGVVLNPGFVGAAGKIFSINFQTKSAGDALVRFSAGTVLANDGKGTSLPVSFGASTIAVIARGPAASAPTASDPPTVPSPAPNARGEVPAAPVVSSGTHPDPAVSYPNRDVELSWSLPRDVTAVSFLLTDKAESNPGPVSDGLVSSAKFKGVGDGTSYFHVRFKNAAGWGAIAHFRINVDAAESGISSLKLVKEGDPFEKGIKVEVKADGGAPQVVRLGAIIDSQAELPLTRNPAGDYLLPPIDAGEHVVTLKAYDQIGNFDSVSEKLTVAPFPAPVIEYALAEVGSRSYLVVRGKTYANVAVTVWLERAGEDPVPYEVTSSQAGDFVFMSRKELDTAPYSFWVEATNQAGLKTNKTAVQSFRVRGAQARSLQSLLETFAIFTGSFLFILYAFSKLFSGPGSRGQKSGTRKAASAGRRLRKP